MCAKKKTTSRKQNLYFSDDFYSDLSVEGMLNAEIVRSPVDSGRLISVETAGIPADYRFIGWNDIPLKKPIKINGVEIFVFCKDKILYKGQPLGLICGPDKAKARQIASNIGLMIEGASGDNNENSVIASRDVSWGKKYNSTEQDLVIETEWISVSNIKYCSENNGALSYVKDGKLHVFAPNLWIGGLRRCLSDATGFAEDDIVITKTRTSSKDTTIIWLNNLTACQCALASLILKKPVKLEFSRNEQSTYAEKTSVVKIHHKTAVNKDTGIIKAMDISIRGDCGAFNPFAQELCDRLAVSCTGIYNCPNITISAAITSSQTIPSSIDFADINSKGCFAIENQMNKIANATGLNPYEIRMVNKIEDPKKTTSPFFFELGKTTAALDAVCKKSNFFRKFAAYKFSGTHRFSQDNTSPFAPPLRGIGLACGYEGTVFSGSFFSGKKLNVEVTCTEDKKLYIKAIPASNNIWQIWQKISASITGFPLEDVILDTNFDNESEPDNPQTTDSSITITTQLLKKACEALKSKIKPDAKYPLTIKKSYTANPKKAWNKDEFTGYPFSSTTFAAMIVELELDSCTYKDQLRGIWFIVDAGKILNPKNAETSIRNSIQEGLRELVEDDEVLTQSISIQFIQSEDEPKQIGEVVSALLPAAYSSALSQAVGKTIRHLPLQTDTIFKLTNNLNEEHKQLQQAIALFEGDKEAKEDKE